MTPYADTNLLTRLYLRLSDTEEALTLLAGLRRSQSQSLPVLWLHRLEFANALQLHVFFARTPYAVLSLPGSVHQP